MTRSLLLHDRGDAACGGPLAAALAAAGVPVDSPPQPGHPGADPIVGRFYQLNDAAVTAAEWFGEHRSADLVIGIGSTGWAAQAVALAGRCGRLVVIDGLGGPFLTIEEQMARRRDRMRSIVEMGAAAPTGVERGLDPRLAFAARAHHDRTLAEDAARGIAIPTMIIETRESTTPPDDAHAIAELFPASIETIADRDPAQIAALVAAWSERPS